MCQGNYTACFYVQPHDALYLSGIRTIITEQLAEPLHTIELNVQYDEILQLL